MGLSETDANEISIVTGPFISRSRKQGITASSSKRKIAKCPFSASQPSIRSFTALCSTNQSTCELFPSSSMSANAVATGIPHDPVKKRKGPPSANEIFKDPVPVTGDAASNGGSVHGAPKKVFVAQSNKVVSLYAIGMRLTRCIRCLMRTR
jgi:hypothetical protein